MRAGRLDTPATMLELSSDLCARELGWVWTGIRAKDAGDVAFPSGLRNPGRVEIRAWWDQRLVQGRYLRAGERLFHIDSARDVMGSRAELVLTCTEFVGLAAEYRPADRMPISCRVFLQHHAPYRDEQGLATDYKTLAEVALIETGRVQVDDQIQVGGELYNVIDYANETDDGIVRGLWLELVQ